MDFILQNIVPEFAFSGGFVNCEKIENGHINDTYAVTTSAKRYVLQKLNNAVFPDIPAVLKNTEEVIAHISWKIVASGGNLKRECLTLIKTRDGGYSFTDENGGVWRATLFIDNALSYARIPNSETAEQAGKAVGRFLTLTSDLPASKITNSIPDFHNTEKRFADFEQALRENPKDRAKESDREINLIYQHKGILDDFKEYKKDMPMRVTHNDTRLANMLFDATSGDALMLIDLDTVMNGYSSYDYGDALRSVAGTPDAAQVVMDEKAFDLFTRAYLNETKGLLTAAEIDALPTAILIAAYELALRYLTDFLTGDAYFPAAYPSQNLDKARVQLKLLSDIEYKTIWIGAAIKRILKRL
ncbi:mucin desulfatase [Clostridia bacterium]|nr:mucin desulfatase [Clostridia bacterium]